MKIIDIKNLKFAYDKNLILKDINFTLDKGEFVAIAGENGSGKSTLIKVMLNELRKNSGSIKLFDTPIEQFNSFDNIGYVPQVNDSSKIAFPITCKEYVLVNLYKEFNIFNLPSKKSVQKVKNVFQSLNISHLLDRPFKDLSGGQQQRVMIARALVTTPGALILDEPTVGIDEKNKIDFLNLLKHLNKNHGISILIISHEMDLIKKYVDRIATLKEGRISHA